MARLDRIIVKHSTEAAEADFVKGLTGDAGVDGGGIEPGEIVLRRGEDFIELWALDSFDEPRKVSIDIGSIEIPWDPLELDNASLGLLGDVDYTDGIAGDLGLGQVGYVLTWDGYKWVVRPQAGNEEYEGLIPTLNDVGDVNYAFFATASTPKYQPVVGDVLSYQFDYIQNKNFWAPLPLNFDALEDVDIVGNQINLNRAKFGAITFNLVDDVQRDNARLTGSLSSVGIEISGTVSRASAGNPSTRTAQYLRINSAGGATFQLAKDLEIRAASTYDKPIIALNENAYTENVSNDLQLVTLRHVNANFATHSIGELSDVELEGNQAGYVLVWNQALQRFEPGPGPAPDLSAASINELADVNTGGKSRGLPLAWDSIQAAWTPQSVLLTDLKFDYFDDFWSGNDAANYTTRCRECNANNLGRITVVENIPYVCLRVRSTATRTFSSTSPSDPLINNRFGYVRLLMDGNGQPEPGSYYPPDENRAALQYQVRTDPLSAVAYGGNLGDLFNVSTADVFPGAAPVWDPSVGQFVMDYPALDLSAYGVGELADVDTTGAGVGYGLLWNGSTWEASTLDQRFKIDDMQDVQFGDLGVTNNKLVAAYQLIQNPELPQYVAGEDVSTVLAVSTAKGTAALGSTREFVSPDLQFYPTARYFGTETNWTIAQKLDNYVRWPHEPSWQTIDGDGCIELFFYCTILLEDRAIFRKVASSGAGGYLLRLKQNGGLEWTVTPPTGQNGFSISTAQNFVSLNNWHHVAVTKEGLTHRLYLDGYLVGTAGGYDTRYGGDGVFTLGRNDLDDNNTLTHNFWRGYMLDLRVTRGRPKYTGLTYTVPYSIGAEILDTTPNAGDFLSYDGTKWTNVAGVTADITGNSIDELQDVDTTSNNPGTGDALVWTGNRWEPGIPGVGATWELDDFTDVSSNYQSGTPWIRLDQADLLTFSTLQATPGDLPYIQSQPTSGILLAYYDETYTCSPFVTNRDGPYADSTTVYIKTGKQGQGFIRGERWTILNKFEDCTLIGYEYHEDSLHYQKCPDRSYDGPGTPYGDIPDKPEETYIPCWGVIQDHIDDLLPYGLLSQLGNVSSIPPTLGQALTWNGNQWAPSSSIAADISNNSISDLADVNAPSPQLDDILKWDGGAWVPTPQLESFFAFTDIAPYNLSQTNPISTSKMLVDDGFSFLPNGYSINHNLIANFAATDPDTNRNAGLRGFSFAAIQDTPFIGVNQRNAYLFGGRGPHMPTILTSGMSTTEGSWLEIGSTNIRIADNGAASNGSGGFSLAEGWKIRYEDGTLDWDSFTADQVPNRRGIVSYVENGLANLDLSPNTIDDLGDVDTTGKLQGYALSWDGAQWVASASVAANISQSSIGDLIDVVKVDNSNASTNDGSISLDVGRLITTRPASAGGGLELYSSNTLGLIGWSPSDQGAPYLRCTIGPLGTSSLTVTGDTIRAQGAAGIQMATQPALGDYTLPTWLQVRQQIARDAVEYTALFLLGCNDFKESAYGWTLSNQVTTIPNPVYDSKFGGESSIRFRRTNQDKIQWTSNNGCPVDWPAALLWSVEFLIKVDSATQGDGLPEYVITEVGSAGSYSSNGLHVFLDGVTRNKVCVRIGSKDSRYNNNIDLSGLIEFDTWSHVYVAHEGGNNVRLYLDGVLQGTKLQTSAWSWIGGLSIGGRTQPSAAEVYSYLSAQLDEVRITRTWLPYGENTNNVPVPVQALPAADVPFVYGTISQLSDVNTLIRQPINGDALIWDGVNGYWAPGTAPAADISASSIGLLSDVTSDNSVPDQDDVLGWSAANSDWRRTKIDGNGGIRPLNARSVIPGQVPTAGNLYAGELFLNMADKKLYALDDTGQAFNFASGDVEGVIETYTRVVGGDF
ncbi:MAG: LamG-like jellyroll fold domain-containing protein [Burkholderiaceae bacterium]